MSTHITSPDQINHSWTCTCGAEEVGAKDAFANAACHLRAVAKE